ncbi:MAG: hypothetical protein WDM85_05910 [Caulobacteraceae bacterium]
MARDGKDLVRAVTPPYSWIAALFQVAGREHRGDHRVATMSGPSTPIEAATARRCGTSGPRR